jgi:hypothetical protein
VSEEKVGFSLEILLWKVYFPSRKHSPVPEMRERIAQPMGFCNIWVAAKNKNN